MFEDIPRPGLWKRLLLGALLCIFAAAGATTVAAFHEVDKVVKALELGPELELRKDALAETDPGEPQTLLILGSDRRPKNNTEGALNDARSDTIMLVRLNPDKEATAIMSLPRDLKVEIPGQGVDKVNAAYSYGGPQKTLDTVKRLTGLPINHMVNVTFKGFWRAVNAIGCVYADIDHDYYNDSAEFQYINIDPGYQRLCSRTALQYVRFRHTDTDLVRSARQQDFLRQAKQQITTSKLIDESGRLMKIFGRNTSTDPGLRSRSEVLRLLKLAIFSARQPIQEIHFEGTIGPSYVEASDAQVKKLVQQFLAVEDTEGPRGQAQERRPARRPKRKRPRGRPDAASLGLYDASTLGEEQALQAVEAGAGGSLPVLYPTLLLNSSEFVPPPRVYKIRGTDGKKYGA
jgi:LCP family protein required for cell wall assembly